MPHILLLAAGRSSRMGKAGDKLLQSLPSGDVLIEDRLQTCVKTGLPVWITLPREALEKRALSDHHKVSIVTTPHQSGMADSIARGVAALPDTCDAVVIVPADMPGITDMDIRNMLDAFTGDHILRACDGTGRMGHPVVFPRRLFQALAKLSGDDGARGLLADEEVHSYALPGDHATLDLDTPDDWHLWRKRFS